MRKSIYLLLAYLSINLTSCKKDKDSIQNKDLFNKSQNNEKGIGAQQLNAFNPCGSLPVSVFKDLKVDFGAMGDGTTDDSHAFLAAADWINNNWSTLSTIELYIPAGIYRVGVQLQPGSQFLYGTGGILSNPLNGPTYQGFDLMPLNNVKNVIIHGAPGMATTILYKSGLYFGGCTNGPTPCNYKPSSICHSCGNINNFASVGSFLSLTNCQCIAIDNLLLDGNASNCLLQGFYGECNGFQLAYDGILITNGSDISVSNTSCSNFGRDGIMTRYTSSNPNAIKLTNVNCIANSRQGFSFTAGNNIVAVNCKFNNTGSIFYNNPSCGLDIEPENGGTCLNSSFTNCQFMNNAFVNMISDNHFPDVSDISFNNCEFVSTSAGGWNLWPCRMKNTSFNNCLIVGRMTHVAGTSTSDLIEFNQCVITDMYFGTPAIAPGFHLLDFGTGPPDNHFYKFNLCNFNVHKSRLIWTEGASPALPSPPGPYSANGRLFQSCKFRFFINDLAGVVPTPPGCAQNGWYIGKFRNCTLYGNVINEDAPLPAGPAPTCGWKYWLGIMIGSGLQDYDCITDNQNTFLPQNGNWTLGVQNPWSRVYRNGGFLWAQGGTLANF